MRSVARNTAARGLCVASVVLEFGLMFGVFFVVEIHGSSGGARFPKLVFSRINNTAFVGKLPTMDEDDDGSTTNRIDGGSCSKDNVAIFQGPTAPLPNGIPTYTVQIQNVCVWGCSVSNIHLSCGWFSSARLINPQVFRRVCYDDCLVNDGEALAPGQSLSFQYANSFSYPLSVSSVTCN